MIARKFPLEPGLWLVGVPIGTARDITLRALDVLASADILAAEDTRSLRKLMDIHGVPLEGRRIQSLHDHSGDAHIERLISALKDGQTVAFASEAGMPLIADPGFELVRAAQNAGIHVTSAPGPTAITTALAIAGLATDAFHFAGFLPNSSGQRRGALSSLKSIPATLVLYESPKRTAATLQDAAEILGTDRPARLCRELTKKFEEVRQGTLGALAQSAKTDPPRGEIVLLIDRSPKKEATPERIEEALRDAMETMSTKDAAAFVADAMSAPKREVYQTALRLKD